MTSQATFALADKKAMLS